MASLVHVSEHFPEKFFANTVYDIHCIPTRDKSVGKASVFTFKHVQLEETATLDARGHLHLHVSHVFGKIKEISPLVSHF